MKSKRHIIYLSVIVLALAIIQADFMKDMSVFGARPDLILLLCSSVGFFTTGGAALPLILSLFAGIIQGAFSDMSPAFYAVMTPLCAYASYRIGNRRHRYETVALVLTAAVCTAAYWLASLAALAASGDINSARGAAGLIVPQIAVNAVLIWPVSLIAKAFSPRKGYDKA